MSDKKETGMIGELTDFFKQSYNFLVICEKPDSKRIFLFFII